MTKLCFTFAALAVSTLADGPPPPRVTTGAAALAESGFASLIGKRVGICSNPTGVLPSLQHIVDVMHSNANATTSLVAIFGPEHGFRGDEQAGQADDYYVDRETGLPVYSLYAKTVTEARQVVFDIQDVGARFYTFIWTMWLMMQAAALEGIHMLVLDRPNPLGGSQVLGPVLQPGFSSGVGRLPIALADAMTIGERALLFREHFLANATANATAIIASGGERGGRGGIHEGFSLTVVQMQGWVRGLPFAQTGLPWVYPSPNMPTTDTATVYPGFGFLEGTNMSTGRGTTRPFEVFGAPYLVNSTNVLISNTLNALPAGPDGAQCVNFREAFYIPTFDRYAGTLVGGAQVYPLHPCFDPVLTAIALIIEAKKLSNGAFAWVEDNYIDLLAGTEAVREGIDAGSSASSIVQSWAGDVKEFEVLRSKYLLY